MAAVLPVFPSFLVNNKPDSHLTTGLRWAKYLSRFENMLIGYDITDDARKKALLLHFAGEEVFDIFETLPETGDDYDTCKEKLTNYFNPRRNVEFEIFKFREAKQEPDETLDTFHTRLRELSLYCEFADKDREIKSQIIAKCSSVKLRRAALRDPQLDLTRILAQGRAAEQTDLQIITMDNKNAKPKKKSEPCELQKDDINRIQRFSHQRKDNIKVHSKLTGPHSVCNHCGGNWPHAGGMGRCPARGKDCAKCGIQNHFARCCKSKTGIKYQNQQKTNNSNRFQGRQQRKSHKVNSLPTVKQDNKSSSDEEYVFSTTKGRFSLPTIKVQIGKLRIPAKMILDTGTSIDMMGRSTYKNLPVSLKPTNVQLHAYASTASVKTLGKFDSYITNLQNNKTTTTTFYVSPDSDVSLLSYKTSQILGFIDIPTLNTISEESQASNELVKEYQDILSGLGKMKDYQVHLHIDETVKPIIQPHRRIPFHLRSRVEDEIQKLLDQDIIEPAKGPTPWISPIVAAPKPKNPSEIRLCIDMRASNTAIERERHITPTVDDLINDLHNAQVFSKLDLNSGYHQLELDEESRYITTFSTHIGLFRYKRLNFGTTSAAEVFQNVIRQTLADIKGARMIL